MEETKKLSLANIKGGACIEMFDRAISEVMANIVDVNTTLKPREIILKCGFAPTRDRTMVSIGIDIKTKLQGQDPEECTADIRIDTRGKAYGVDRTPQQQDLPFVKNVTSIKKGE